MPATHALIDIGNVLLAFEYETILRKMVPNASAAEAESRMNSILARKDDFESGLVGEDEYIAWSSEQLGFPGSADDYREAWNSIFNPIEDMWRSIEDLKAAGVTLILFSNTNPIHAESFAPNYEVFAHFDHAVFSHEVGALKPDERIYQHAIAEYGLDPGQTLYVDDLAENIATGERFGLRCHQYDHRNHRAFLDWLEKNG